MQNLVPLMVILVLVLLLFTVMDAMAREDNDQQVVITHNIDCVIRVAEGQIYHRCKLRPVSGYHRALLDDSE